MRPLLTVKQLIPLDLLGAVPRLALEQRLRAADTGLTIVVAPAGWGKTSLLSAWASNPGERVRVAWVSLDESDDEPTRFWTYALTALRGASDDEVSRAAMERWRSPGPSVDQAAILLNELAASSIPHVLVLDDFHVLGNARIDEGVEFLVAYLPPSLPLVKTGGRTRRCHCPATGPRGSDRDSRGGSSVNPRPSGRPGVDRVGHRPGRRGGGRGVGADAALGGRTPAGGAGPSGERRTTGAGAGSRG